jgi:hypothetical protein
MDSRQKANDLVNRYYYMLPNNGELNSGINSCESRYNEAIGCAFVAIDELIDNSYTPVNQDYWFEVYEWLKKIKDKEPGARWTIEDMKQSKTTTII